MPIKFFKGDMESMDTFNRNGTCIVCINDPARARDILNNQDRLFLD